MEFIFKENNSSCNFYFLPILLFKKYFTHKNIYFINVIHLNFDNNNRYRTFRVHAEYYVFNNH